jgi:hypothetical protein
MTTETDAQKFKRLATRRVNLVLKHIRLIGNLSNRSNYTYTANDVEKIFKTLDAAVAEAKEKFDTAKPNGKTPFTLD